MLNCWRSEVQLSEHEVEAVCLWKSSPHQCAGHIKNINFICIQFIPHFLPRGLKDTEVSIAFKTRPRAIKSNHSSNCWAPTEHLLCAGAFCAWNARGAKGQKVASSPGSPRLGNGFSECALKSPCIEFKKKEDSKKWKRCFWKMKNGRLLILCLGTLPDAEGREALLFTTSLDDGHAPWGREVLVGKHTLQQLILNWWSTVVVHSAEAWNFRGDLWN